MNTATVQGGVNTSNPRDDLTTNTTTEVTEVTDFAIHVACTGQPSTETRRSSTGTSHDDCHHCRASRTTISKIASSTAPAGRTTYHGQLATTTTTLENTSSNAQLRQAADPTNDGEDVQTYRATSDPVRCPSRRDVVGTSDADSLALPSALGFQVGCINMDHAICTRRSRKQHATQHQMTADINTTPVSLGATLVGMIDLGKATPPIVSYASCYQLAMCASNATGKPSRSSTDEGLHNAKLAVDAANAGLQHTATNNLMGTTSKNTSSEALSGNALHQQTMTITFGSPSSTAPFVAYHWPHQ